MGERMKTPDECRGLEDIRFEIDRLDKEIVGLLGRRLGYVLKAAYFKKNEADIPAAGRVTDMLVERCIWVREGGIFEDFVEEPPSFTAALHQRFGLPPSRCKRGG